MQGKNIETNNAETIPQIPQISFSRLLWIFFEASIQFIKDFLRFLYKNVILIGICLLLGLAFGYFSYKVPEHSYNVSMIVKCAEPGTDAFEEMIDTISRLITGETPKEVAAKLHTSPEISDALLSISSKALQSEEIQEDTQVSRSRFFAIEIKLKDFRMADTLQNLVLDYFNRNPYLANFQEEMIRLYERRLSLLDEEINALNGLRESYPYFLNKSERGPRLSNDKLPDLTAISIRLSDSYKEKERIVEWLQLTPASVVKIDAVTTAIRDKGKLLKRMIAFGIASFIVGCFIAACVVVIRKQGR